MPLQKEAIFFLNAILLLHHMCGHFNVTFLKTFVHDTNLILTLLFIFKHWFNIQM